MIKLTVTPKFNTKEIIDNTIGKFWFQFQLSAFNLGLKTQQYMINYIKTHKHRAGGTGLLESSINLETASSPGSISWGVGAIANLPKYWYVVNYGKKVTGEDFIPGMGKVRPVMFSDGGADASKRGAGTGQVWGIRNIIGENEPLPSKIRPLNYMQATRAKLNANLRNLINRLKKVG